MVTDPFILELRDWLEVQVKFIDDARQRVDADIQHNSGYRCFEPTEQEERDQRDRKEQYERLMAERDAYATVWKKVAREIEIDKFMADVETWLPRNVNP